MDNALAVALFYLNDIERVICKKLRKSKFSLNYFAQILNVLQHTGLANKFYYNKFRRKLILEKIFKSLDFRGVNTPYDLHNLLICIDARTISLFDEYFSHPSYFTAKQEIYKLIKTRQINRDNILSRAM